MKVSDKGLMAIIAHEGIVQSRYKDSKGIWTIGVGHTKMAGGLNPETFTGVLPVADLMDLFRQDIAKFEKGVNDAIKVPISQHEFDALVSFHYNTGAVAKATLTATLNKGDHKSAGLQFMNWVKPPEIKNRRSQEMNLFLYGTYPVPLTTIYSATASGTVLWGSGKRVNLEQLTGMIVPPPADMPPDFPSNIPFTPREIIPEVADAVIGQSMWGRLAKLAFNIITGKRA